MFPKLTKNLIFISKLTDDNLVNVFFLNGVFTIENQLTKEPLPQAKSKDELYVLQQGQHVFLVIVSSTHLKASYELWHRRLGHASFEYCFFT